MYGDTHDGTDGGTHDDWRRVPDVAVAGLGLTELGRVYDRTATQFAVDAVHAAAADAGIGLDEIDGLLINPGITRGIGLPLQRDLALRDLRLLAELQAYGSSAGVMLAQAAMAIGSGTASVVACVFADAPLRAGASTGDAYVDPALRVRPGFAGMAAAGGLLGPNVGYALAARRHMDRFGTTSEQLGAIAVSTREWAMRNPRMRPGSPGVGRLRRHRERAELGGRAPQAGPGRHPRRDAGRDRPARRGPLAARAAAPGRGRLPRLGIAGAGRVRAGRRR
ncbi:MAG: thiolase family protein [Pseudonocardia sp.]|nr:thiolase family protein [Pseudonocardia sp.]